MTLATWNHECTVGVRAMDDQHGILMDTLNELRLAVIRGQKIDEVAAIYDRFIEFTRMHFWSEEKLLEQRGYPYVSQHRDAHLKLLATMMQQAHSVAHGERGRSQQILSLIRDEFMEHVEGQDQIYGIFLNNLGIY